MEAARAAARHLDTSAVERAEQERAQVEGDVRARADALREAEQRAEAACAAVAAFEQRRSNLSLAADATTADVERWLAELAEQEARAANDLRTLGTREYDSVLSRERGRLETVTEHIAEAERAAGRARRATTTALA